MYCSSEYHVAMARKKTEPAGLPDPRCDVAGLRAFLAVARLGSVSRAAVALDRTQPSISARLAALEDVWNTRLFRRGARGMTLTPEGARLLPGAESALREFSTLDRIAGVPATPADDLRVGAGDALGRERLPRALSKLLSEHPTLEVHIREGPGSRLLESLRDGEIDLALLVRPRDGEVGEGIERAPLFASDIDLLSPPGRRPPGRRPVALGALAGRRLVTLQPGSAFRRHLEAAFRSAGVPFAPAVEVGNLSLVLRFVAAGLGVAPFPAVALGPGDLGGGIERRRLGGVPPVIYERAVRSGAPHGPATARLLKLLGCETGRC